MEKYLITGGAGFIGSKIAKYLFHQGHYVRIMDNFYSGRKVNLDFAFGLESQRIEIVRGDITCMRDCEEACEGMDFVFHQAARLSVAESMKEPFIYNNVNINGTLFMLQAAVKYGIKRFVFASSAAVYGNAGHFPLNENDAPKPISPYALSKLAGEYYCRIFSENSDLETVCLRYFNVFGPGQAPGDEYASVIPKFIELLLEDQPTPIFGTGQQTRDFVFIKDIVLANVLCAKAPGLKHEVFNVASGHTITILEFAGLLRKILSKDIEPRFLPNRSGDIFKIDVDISKIKQAVGFLPSTTFEEGLKQTVDYFQRKWEGKCQLEKSSAGV